MFAALTRQAAPAVNGKAAGVWIALAAVFSVLRKGYQFDGYEHTVNSHINRLRKKVDRGFDTKLIHTVRGVGYVLKA